MKFISKKRLAIAAVPVAGALAYAGVAIAAQNSVATSSLGSNNVAVAANCNLTESYTTAWEAADTFDTTGGSTPNNASGYYVTQVTTTPGSTACNGLAYKVTLADGSNVQLAEVTSSFATPAIAKQQNLAIPQLASSVDNVFGVVTG